MPDQLDRDQLRADLRDIVSAAMGVPWHTSSTAEQIVAAVLERVAPQVEPPEGLCGNREDHAPHRVEFAAVANGPMWCHADQRRRLPYALEAATREPSAEQ